MADIKYFGLFGEFDDIIDHRGQVVLGHLIPAEGPKGGSSWKQFNVAPERTKRNRVERIKINVGRLFGSGSVDVLMKTKANPTTLRYTDRSSVHLE